MSNRRMESIVSVTLVVCAVAITASVVVQGAQALWGSGSGANASAAAPRLREEVWRETLAASSRISGTDSARVRIAVFTDFQCPACRYFHNQIRPIVDEFGDRVEIAVVHYPLPRYRHSNDAARAFECASERGYGLHFANLVFELQDSIGTMSWGELARRAGDQDTLSHASCMASTEVASRVSVGRAVGKRIGIDGTPTVFMNSWGFLGVPSAYDLRERIVSMLEGDPE